MPDSKNFSSHHYQIHESESVDDSVRDIISRPDFGGASVTFPHKVHVGKLLDFISPSAERVGAVNTIIVKQRFGCQRVLIGDNTDWLGIKRCIQKSGAQNLQSSTALVLGAGGAARAACFAIQELGIPELIIVNRTTERAEKMASQFPSLHTRIFSSLQDVVLASVDPAVELIIACVPADDLGEDKIPNELFSRSEEGVLVEMAYRPQVTGMIKMACRHHGWRVFRGVDVLEEQAYAQFELWTEKPSPMAAMQAAMRAKLESAL